MDFDKALKKAIDRGRRRQASNSAEQEAQKLSLEQLRDLHSKYQLQVSDHVESCIQQLTEQLPGFKFETIYGDRGWGAAASRDDFAAAGGKRTSLYSRLEISVRPFSDYHVLDLTAKATVQNKEVFNRNFFDKLAEVEIEEFLKCVDAWVLEFAEIYSVRS